MISFKVRKGVKEAREMLLNAQRPGVGTSLRRARISKALTELHVLENACKSEREVGRCKSAILSAQVIGVEFTRELPCR